MLLWPTRLCSLEDRFSQPKTASLVLLVFPLTVFIIYANLAPARPLLANDSAGYMYFDSSRTIGYPIFLYIIKHLTGSYASLRYEQLAILCIAVYVSAISIFLWRGRLLVPLLFEMGTLGHPGLIEQTNPIMPDSLSTSAFLLFIAAIFYFARSPSLRRYTIICVVFAVAITVRPVNISMVLPALLLPGLLWRQQRLRMTACLLLGLFSAVAAWETSPVVNALLSGKSEKSYILAVNLFHRTIYIDPGKEPPSKECDSDFIEEIAAPVRNYLKTVPSEFRGLLRAQYTEYVRFSSIVRGLAARHNFASETQTGSILMCYALARYRQNPVAMLEDVAVNYWYLISNYSFIDKAARDRLTAFLQANPPVLVPTFPLAPQERMMHAAAVAEIGAAGHDTMGAALPPNLDPWPARPLVLILALKVVQLSAVAVTVVLVFLLLPALLGKIGDRDLMLMALISLHIELALLIVALADVAQARYITPVWPGLWLVLIWGFSRLLGARIVPASPVADPTVSDAPTAV